MGGPEMAPQAPHARDAPASPWRPSISRRVPGGPEMAPQTPQRSEMPRRGRGAPRLRCLSTSRRGYDSRGATRSAKRRIDFSTRSFGI